MWRKKKKKNNNNNERNYILLYDDNIIFFFATFCYISLVACVLIEEGNTWNIEPTCCLGGTFGREIQNIYY